MLIDYYYDPTVAAELAAWVNYICPVVGRQGGDGRRSTPTLAKNPLIFPTDETLAEDSRVHGARRDRQDDRLPRRQFDTRDRSLR